jgi:hypothetical protein
MAITVSISPTGLILESAAKNNSNFEWDDYLKISPMIIDNDQILVHYELESVWADWLIENFEIDTRMEIDQTVDQLIQQSTWSAESGFFGTLALSSELEQLVLEKMSSLNTNDFISLSVTP